MSQSAKTLNTAEAAKEAVKAYIRMNRAALAEDGELLSLLLPGRFDTAQLRDLQAHVIEKLRAENARLRAERDGLRGARDDAQRLSDGVRNLVLDLLDARSFEEAIEVATSAAPRLGADHCALCVESPDAGAITRMKGVRLIAPGTANAVLGPEGMGAILAGGGELLLGPDGAGCGSVAAFRLRIGRGLPLALFVLGAQSAGDFEGEEAESGMRFLARALERTIRSWLDLPHETAQDSRRDAGTP